jgi:hypothetical protein
MNRSARALSFRMGGSDHDEGRRRRHGGRSLLTGSRGVRLAAAMSALALVIAAQSAMAQDAEEPIRLEYQASSGCIDEPSFVALVRARAPRVRLAGDAEQARTFHVRLAADARPSGSVTVVDGSRDGGTRQVDADTCGEVADELSLIVALALDPHTLTRPPAPPSTVPSLPVSVDAGAPLPAPVASSVPAQPAPVTPAPLPPPPQPPEPEKATSAGTVVEGVPAPLGLHYFGGVDLVVATGVAPIALVGGSPYVGWRSTGASLVGVTVRAAFLRIGTGALPVQGGGTADFTWTAGRLDACGLLRPDRALRPGGCARLEAGVLAGTGGQIIGETTRRSAWVTGGALARIEWSFLGSLVVAVGAGPTVRLNEGRFIFLPGKTVYQVPLFGLEAEAGLGVHFL